MRRVVISGIGVVSCLGNSKEDVLDSLKAGRSGISFNESFKEMGLRSHVGGSVESEVSFSFSSALTPSGVDMAFVDRWMDHEL